MLWTPQSLFQWQFSSSAATRPNGSAWGINITSGAANTKGSYTEIISDASVTTDVYGILVELADSFASTVNRSGLTDIGVDTSGGTSYTVVIPDLLTGGHITYSLGHGATFYFPLFIPSGSAIAARWQCAAATVTEDVKITVFGKPRYPHLVRVGQKVVAYGTTAASSQGTAVTPGTTSDGTYADIGTTSADHWYWQYSWSTTDSSTTAQNMQWWDYAYGDASNKHLMATDLQSYIVNSTEGKAGFSQLMGDMGYHEVASGAHLYARSQCSGTADSGFSAMFYGVCH